MNLIELSEQLKDVPDQLLMKEVQAPSGAYPSYLVVTEMSRRKRMRDQAMKQAPTTTVAQDLTQPSREDMMRAMAATQQQMAPPQLVSNAPAGIMGMPEASQALAAQDVMAAQEPRRMAGGGMVAFKQGGDVPRFQNQGFVFPEGSLIGRMQRGELQGSLLGTTDVANEMLAREIEADRRRRELEAAAEAERRRMENRAASMSVDAAARTRTPPGSGDRTAGSGTSAAPTSSAGPAAPALPTINVGQVPTLSITPYVDPYAAAATANQAAFGALKVPSAADLAAARATAETQYGEKNPFRYGFLEQDITKRQGELAARRGSNINEALIQTGLGIMGSKSPRFLQAVGEAGSAGLNAYRQGLKDIREGERDILQSRTALANAQTLYDQGKTAAGEKAEDRANQQYERGISRLNTESAMIARNQAQAFNAAQLRQQGEIAQQTAGINALKTQAELQKLPYELGQIRAITGYYNRMPTAGRGSGGITDADQKAAEEAANRSVMMNLPKGVKIGSPEYQALWNQYYSQELQRRAAGLSYTPGTPAAPAGPVVRGSPTAPLGAQ